MARTGVAGATYTKSVGTSTGPHATTQHTIHTTNTPSVDAKLPLASRSIDIWLAIWFVVFAFSTTFTDLHNFIASVRGVPVTALEHMDLPYPPKFLTNLYFRWARTVDPLLYENPVWWQCIEWVNLVCLTPFALIAPLAILAGWRHIRIPAIVVSSFTFYSLILCIGSTLFGPSRSADPSTFTGVYIIYLTQPVVVVLRFWADGAFTRRGLSDGWNSFLVFATSINFAVFASYVIRWLVLYQPDLLPAAAVPFLLQAVSHLP